MFYKMFQRISLLLSQTEVCEQVLLGTRLFQLRFVLPGGYLVPKETPGETVGSSSSLVLCKGSGWASQWPRSK